MEAVRCKSRNLLHSTPLGTTASTLPIMGQSSSFSTSQIAIPTACGEPCKQQVMATANVLQRLTSVPAFSWSDVSRLSHCAFTQPLTVKRYLRLSQIPSNPSYSAFSSHIANKYRHDPNIDRDRGHAAETSISIFTFSTMIRSTGGS